MIVENFNEKHCLSLIHTEIAFFVTQNRPFIIIVIIFVRLAQLDTYISVNYVVRFLTTDGD